MSSNNISKLFQDRRLGIKKAQNKKRREAAKSIKPITVVPEHRPTETIGRNISSSHTDLYRPSSSPIQVVARKTQKSKSHIGYFPKYLGGSSGVSKPFPHRPIPKDSNYRQCNTGPEILKFVDCKLCGKQGFSSHKQLLVHQKSKKCENRQLRDIIHKCHICDHEFDTPHNLEFHICHK